VQCLVFCHIQKSTETAFEGKQAEKMRFGDRITSSLTDDDLKDLVKRIQADLKQRYDYDMVGVKGPEINAVVIEETIGKLEEKGLGNLIPEDWKASGLKV